MVLDISDIATILVIAGIMFIFIAIVREISGYLKTSITTKQAIILGITGVILLGLGLFTSGEILPLPTPTPPVTPSQSPTITPAPTPAVTIEITNPKNGAEVSSFPLIVEGTFEGELPEDWYLWLVFYNYDEWYALSPIQPFEGKWYSRIWSPPGTIGKRDIAVLLVDKDGDSEFHRYSAEEELFRILPQRTQVCDRITIEVK